MSYVEHRRACNWVEQISVDEAEKLGRSSKCDRERVLVITGEYYILHAYSLSDGGEMRVTKLVSVYDRACGPKREECRSDRYGSIVQHV